MLTKTNCTVCSSPTREIIDLGSSPPANTFVSGAEQKHEIFPLVLEYCSKCSCLQLRDCLSEQELYSEYTYITPKTESIKGCFEEIKAKFQNIDFVIHAAAFSDKNELNGKYINTSKDNFIKTLNISCFSFTEISKYASEIMNGGGSLLTLSFYGSNKVMPNYNVMGVAKAALETSVKYLSVDLGSKNIRVNAISAGPMRTLAGAAIANARDVYNYTQANSALKRNVKLEEIGNAALYFVSDLSNAVTGEVHYVDCGFNILGMPKSNT